MSEIDATDAEAILEFIHSLVEEERFRVTQHAQQEMIEEDIKLDEVLEAISNSSIIENYPEHKRGACCLLNGRTTNKRYLHIVCTTTRSILIIITVYEPKPPKWPTPTQRRQ